jgi:hypothetical protein
VILTYIFKIHVRTYVIECLTFHFERSAMTIQSFDPPILNIRPRHQILKYQNLNPIPNHSILKLKLRLTLLELLIWGIIGYSVASTVRSHNKRETIRPRARERSERDLGDKIRERT